MDPLQDVGPIALHGSSTSADGSGSHCAVSIAAGTELIRVFAERWQQVLVVTKTASGALWGEVVFVGHQKRCDCEEAAFYRLECGALRVQRVSQLGG